MYEVYFIDGARKVSWFWGDGDVVIPTSPYSTLIAGEKAHTSTIKYRDIFRTLRQFEDFHRVYREIRERHNKAVAKRINDLRKLTPLENYQDEFLSTVLKVLWHQAGTCPAHDDNVIAPAYFSRQC